MRSTYRVLFYLKKNTIQSNGKTVIMVRITINGEIAQLSSKLMVQPELWDTRTGRVKGRTAEANNINRQLDNFKVSIDKEFNKQMEESGYVTPEKIKNSILGIDKKYKTILEYFDNHNKQYSLKVGYTTTDITYKRYMLLRERVATFIKTEYNLNDLPINEINSAFLDSFYVFIRKEYHSAHNNAVKAMQRLRKIFLYARNTGLSIPDPFWDFKFGFEDTHREYLSIEEITRIYDKKVVTKRLEQVKDIFIFSCYTGLSYVDICNLRESNIRKAVDESMWIMSKRQKTDVQFNVLLLSLPLQIIDKYKGTLKEGMVLPVISNQKMNEYLKEIGDICGITKNLTFHMARHTFATTITLSNGVPIETVSKMLGHKSIKTTQIYAKITDMKISHDMKMLSDKLDHSVNSHQINGITA